MNNALTLLRIETPEHPHYPMFLDTYVQSFPIDERRETENYRELLLPDIPFQLHTIAYQSEYLGFLTSWQLDESTCYIEHFAIDPSKRSQGLGGEVLQRFSDMHKEQTIILEVEYPDTPQAIRRIDFYTRHGFTLWDTPYEQPPYRSTTSPLPLKLMTKGSANAPDSTLIETLHRTVYHWF